MIYGEKISEASAEEQGKRTPSSNTPRINSPLDTRKYPKAEAGISSLGHFIDDDDDDNDNNDNNNNNNNNNNKLNRS